jgi:hypothetical protein
MRARRAELKISYSAGAIWSVIREWQPVASEWREILKASAKRSVTTTGDAMRKGGGCQKSRRYRCSRVRAKISLLKQNPVSINIKI